MIDWNVYPRPQLVRKDWMCLNGEWTFNEKDTIVVPFCPESKLSGVQGQDWIGKTLSYERTVNVPAEWTAHGDRIILHIGAADQEAHVYINGAMAGEHKGGYLPFSVDITEYIKEDNDLLIETVDNLDHKYPWGKQKVNRGGMWYTPVSGIWQSVWLEHVPSRHIESLKIDTGLNWVEIRAYGVTEGTIELLGEKHELLYDDASSIDCASIHLDIRWPHLWSPEDPYLYNFSIKSGDDEIESYFALRTLGIAEINGHQRLCLNGEPYFFNGLLDQGYWQDGIYTPSSYKCYEQDILAMKKLGFNTLRKHIKIEPEQFYYDCDRLGMIVFQDMVNNGDYSFLKDSALPTIGLKTFTDVDKHNNPESREMFLKHMEDTVKHLYNHPSICYWTIFNEGWGQFCADDCYDRLRELDQTRFIDSTSGWFKQNKSDVDSYHVYFKPVDLTAGTRPMVLSEFGGYSCLIEEHNKATKPYGYKKFPSPAKLLDAMVELYEKQILPLIDRGLSAAIYTQLSDIEDEVNGLVTYDREYNKIETYVGTGRVELIGNHTDHQGGRVLVCPTEEKIRAYVADNNEKKIRVHSEGFEPFELPIGQGTIEYEKGTSRAIVAGLLTGFTDRFGEIADDVKGFDCYIKSDIIVGGGSSSSAAFEILIARMINDKLYNGIANPVEIAKIGMFSERAFYGKPCGMQDQLAISLGKPALLDFSRGEPEYELIKKDITSFGYKMSIVPTQSDHASANAAFAKIPEDMTSVAHAMGLERLGDITRDKFLWSLPELKKKVEEGEISEIQLNRARHFYDETERALAGAAAIETGNFAKFLACVNESGLSSENLLKNILLEGETENNLSRTLEELKKRPDIDAVKLQGGGFGGSVLTFSR